VISFAIEAGSRLCAKAAAVPALAVCSSLTAASTAPVRGSTRTIDPRRVPNASRAARLRPRSIERRTPPGRRQPLQDAGQEGASPASATTAPRATVATSSPCRSTRNAAAPALRASSARFSRAPRPREARGTGLAEAIARAPASSPARGQGPPRTGFPPGGRRAARGRRGRQRVEAAFLERRQDERLGREGLEDGERDGLGTTCPARAAAAARPPRAAARAAGQRSPGRSGRPPRPCRRRGGAPSPREVGRAERAART